MGRQFGFWKELGPLIHSKRKGVTWGQLLASRYFQWYEEMERLELLLNELETESQATPGWWSARRDGALLGYVSRLVRLQLGF